MRVIFADRECRTLGERTWLKPEWLYTINSLMSTGLQYLRINGHIFTEPDSVLLNIVAAASSYNSSIFVTVCCHWNTSGFACG